MKFTNVIHAIDLHACGEPGRVIVGGITDVPGETMYDKMCHLEQKPIIFVNGCCVSREVILLQTAILYCRHETRKQTQGL